MQLLQRAGFSAGFLIAAAVAVAGCGSSGNGGAGSGGAPGSGGSSAGSGGGTGSGGGPGTGGSPGSGGGTGSGGAVATDGGSGGTPGSDGGNDTATAACTFAFCEDFESDTAGMPPNQTRWHQDGTPTIVDAMKPHKGAQALHVLAHRGGLCTDGQPCTAARFARLTDAFPPALHKQHYGRLFFYISQTPTDLAYYHWMVMEVNAGTSYSGGLALRQGGEMPAGGPLTGGVAKNIMLTHVDTHDKTGCSPPPATCYETERGRTQTQTPITNKTWYCLEWFIDATNQQAKYWLDGNQRAGLDWNGPVAGQPQFNLPAEFKSLAVGMRVFQTSTQNFELFVDDVALDSKKIGCD